MLKFSWNMTTIKSLSDFEYLKKTVDRIKPTIGAFDTETSGLHIINDKPFLVQFGFIDMQNKEGYTFAVDLENTGFAPAVIEYWHSVAETLDLYMGHNVKYDLHMMDNIGMHYNGDNLTDTMFYIRYGHDAVHVDEGGAPLKLKEYATRYIDRNAKQHENLLTREKSDIVKVYNMRLKTMLNQSNALLPEGVKEKSFTVGLLNKMFSDCIFDESDLPEDIKKVYSEWKSTLPTDLQHKVQALVEKDMIRYNDLNRENVIKYAHYDIVYTLEIWASLAHIIEHRHQLYAIEIENKTILPWYEMEKYGFNADAEYLEACRIKVKRYINKQRTELYNIAGKKIKTGQGAEIIKLMKERFNIELTTTKDEVIDRIRVAEETPEAAKRFIKLLQELRTLEKWYSAYILRFQKDLKINTRLYTQIQQVGAVTGRVTSDFQQFPKDPIVTEDGEELFHPRKIIRTDTAIVYLDYSQIELRLQAMYTYLIGKPDKNMCRAYMPFECYRLEGNIKWYFNPERYKDIKDYRNYKWYHNEDDTEWEPVDVHGATTLAAFPGLKKTDPEFHSLRYIGKRVNFAKNYGAELNRVKQMFPEKTHEECVMINDAYYKAFPGVKEYHKFCNHRAAHYSYTENLFGIRYYNASGHKLKNILIQGSGAFFLKLRIIKLYEFCKENNIKSHLQMQIHDELSWEWDIEDNPETFFKFKEIMETWSAARIPIVADMEVTTSTWAAKQEIETLEELKEVLNYEV